MVSTSNIQSIVSMYFESTDRSDENLDAYFTSGYRQKGSHSSEKRGLRSTFLSVKMLQNLPYL